MEERENPSVHLEHLPVLWLRIIDGSCDVVSK